MDAELYVIVSSCPADVADAIAQGLVERRMAACVSALAGARSTYRWQEQIQQETETLLLIKVPRAQVDACAKALQDLHPYEVPEIVILPASGVAASYLAWAQQACRPPS